MGYLWALMNPIPGESPRQWKVLTVMTDIKMGSVFSYPLPHMRVNNHLLDDEKIFARVQPHIWPEATTRCQENVVW